MQCLVSLMARVWRCGPASWGYVYGPVDPSTTFEDVEGARYAFDTDTHWKFAHCSPIEQINLAADIRTFTYAQFQRYIDAKTDVHKKRAIREFAEQSANEAFRIVRSATLGEFHRDPHDDHHRDIAVKGIEKVWAAWLLNASRITDRTNAKQARDAVVLDLGRIFTIEWRHQRAPLWAQAGRDPVSGFEWIYTLVPTANHTIPATDLPDPDWHFDASPKGGYVKGSQTYLDHAPRATPENPWILPFKRPVTAGARVGTSIGRVEWTREKAYQ